MNQINPKSLKIIHGLPPVAKKGDKVALDSEFFGQEKERLHRPHGTFAFLGASYDGQTVYYITESEQIQEFMDRLDEAVHIYHNAKYDIRQLRNFAHMPQRKKLWDTMLIEQIMYSGYYNDFSLADVVRRRLDIYLPKEERESFSTVGEEKPKKLTQSQIQYSAVDVAATWRVYEDQRKEIDENDLNIWKEVELPFLWVLLAMGGVKLDCDAWLKLAKENKEKADAIQAKYGTVSMKGKVKKVDGLNLGSHKQLKERFLEMGLTLASTGEEVLEAYANKPNKIGKFTDDILAFRKYSKRASTYGEKFVTDYVEEDGKVYADLYQIGAETARTSCRHPNLQNQPHEKEYRSCFIADEGNCMVVADYGSQEPRIAAYFSQDGRLIEILNSDKKLYIEIARDVFHQEITKQDEVYGHIKSTILGIFYGMSAYGLSERLGISEDEAQEMIDKIIETYPGIQDYIDQQKQAGDYVQSIYGRKIWINKYDKGWLRGALNYPIQSSAADATKLASRRFLDKWFHELGDYMDDEDVKVYYNSPLRLLVHDEIVIEVEQAWSGTAKRILEDAMVEVAEEMHDGLKGVAEVFVGDNWGCKS